MRRTVVVLTLRNTILAAIVAGLAVDASTRADQANRESQRLALVATGTQTGITSATDYQTTLVTDVLASTQESLALNLTALQLAQAGDAPGAEELTAQANVAQARATRLMSLSDLYADPRYQPDAEGGFPRVQDYLDDQNTGLLAIVAEQNSAADVYDQWSTKGDAYVAVLSILAVTFFLLGLAQVSRRMRPFLAACAGTLIVVGSVWAASVALG